jgi:hypothetical protein
MARIKETKIFKVEAWDSGTLHVELDKPYPRRMSKKTALAFSIKKWSFIVACLKRHPEWEGLDDGCSDTCALCSKYIENQLPELDACEGCPIAEDGHRNCLGTHWSAFAHAISNDELLDAAKKELAYLKKLQAGAQ